MANGKKSFVLYADLMKSVDHLTEEELGKLFKHILEYVNDMNPVLEDRVILSCWKPIERTLKEDLKKWEKQLEQRREAGKKSAESRKRKPTSVNDRKRASTDSVTVSVSDTDNKSIYRRFAHLSISFEEFEKLEKKYGKQNVDDMIDQIENFKNNTKYNSLYLTTLNWLKGKYPDKTDELKPLDRVVAHVTLQSDELLKQKLEQGYTKEQIQKYAGL